MKRLLSIAAMLTVAGSAFATPSLDPNVVALTKPSTPVTQVPEPEGIVLALVGVVGVVAVRRFMKKK